MLPPVVRVGLPVGDTGNLPHLTVWSKVWYLPRLSIAIVISGKKNPRKKGAEKGERGDTKEEAA
jgi:hypothetical protein